MSKSYLGNTVAMSGMPVMTEILYNEIPFTIRNHDELCFEG